MTDAPDTRPSLLVALRAHGPEAWDEFLSVYEAALLRFCGPFGLQEADARDATQEVLAALHQRLASWDPDLEAGSFRGWLFRVARNVSVDVVARRARTPQTAEAQLEALEDEEQASTVFDLELRRSLFGWAAERVRSEVRSATWSAFERTAIEGRAPEEVATELGLSVGAVYTAKCRVVARLKARIAELEEVVPDPSA